MKKSLQTLSLIAFFQLSFLFAFSQGINSIVVTPSQPTTSTPVNVGIEYYLSNGCWSYVGYTSNWSGNTLTVYLNFNNTNAPTCPFGFTTGVQNINLGTMSAGTYNVNVYDLDQGGQFLGSTSFTVTGSSTCAAPTLNQLSANNVGSNSATINCAVTGVQSYRARYRVSGNNTWTTLSSTTNNFYNLNNLSPTTQYDFQYQVQCNNGVWSPWSSTKTFITNIPQTCNAPSLSQLYANNITANSARLNCSMTGVLSYDWRYRVLGNSTWSNVPAGTNNYYNLTSLIAGTQYEYQASVKCNNGTWSAWSGTKVFTTSAAQTCPPPSSSQLFTSNPGSNTYTINCSLTGVLSYDWQYRVAGNNNAWIDVPSSSNPYYNLTGLFVTTFYEWRCSVKCQNGVWSPWSNIQSFITNIPQTGGLANDDPCGATTLQLNGGCINVTNAGATTTMTPPAPSQGDCPTNGMLDVWFKIYMPASGVANVWMTAGTLTDAVIAGYSGSSCTSLTFFGCVDDSGENMMPDVEITSTPFTYVYLRVWGYNGASGTFSICGQVGFDGGSHENGIKASSETTDTRSANPKAVAPTVNKIEQSFSLSPNPANSNLTLAFHLEAIEEATFDVLNMEGRVMESGIIEGDDRSNGTRQLDVSALPGGMYFLRLKVGKQVLTERFVKQ